MTALERIAKEGSETRRKRLRKALVVCRHESHDCVMDTSPDQPLCDGRNCDVYKAIQRGLKWKQDLAQDAPHK